MVLRAPVRGEFALDGEAGLSRKRRGLSFSDRHIFLERLVCRHDMAHSGKSQALWRLVSWGSGVYICKALVALHGIGLGLSLGIFYLPLFFSISFTGYASSASFASETLMTAENDLSCLKHRCLYQP